MVLGLMVYNVWHDILTLRFFPDDALGSQSLFITGEKLGQIKATKEV